MNAPVLVLALVAPLLGALLAALVPSGRSRSRLRRASRRRDRPAAVEDDDDDDAEIEMALVVELPEAEGASDVEGPGLVARTLVRVAALAAAAGWVAVVLLGGATAGRFVASGAVAPAGAGAALALAAVSRPARKGPACAAALALCLLSGGLALAAGAGSTTATTAALTLAAGVVLAAAATVAENDGGLGPMVMALAGMVAVVAALGRPEALGASSSGSSAAPFLLVVGGALLAVGGGLRTRRAGAVLLPVGLAIGVAGATGLGSSGHGTALVLALAAAGAAGASALVPGGFGGVRLVVVSLALVTLAVAAVPPSGLIEGGPVVGAGTSGGSPAAWLLAAATVITSVVLVPLAAWSALPGAAAVVASAAVDPEPARLGVVALAIVAAVAAVVGLQRRSDDEAEAAGEEAWSQLLVAVPALAATLWLVVAPRTWAWVGETGLAAWPDSIALALAGGLVAAVAAGASGRVGVPAAPHLVAADPLTNGPDGRGARLVVLAASAALGVALLVLVVSGGQGG